MNDESILKDIRIIDFTWVLAGPYATRLLADFGAEVIKVQPILPAEDESPFAQSYYNLWNRNKLGISLNLNTPDGIEIAKKLVSVSDIVIENFTPRVMANWGLDYENLRKIKSDIIMLSMSVMGQTGPQCDYTGFGPTVQALSGMTALTSFDGESPLGPGFSYADHVAGLYASLAILGALEHRMQTVEGQYIDISQVETMVSLLGNAFIDASTGKDINFLSADRQNDTPYNVYTCSDGKRIAVSLHSDEDRDRLDEIDTILKQETQRYTATESMVLIQQKGIAAGVIHDVDDLVNDPQLISRDFFIRNTDGNIVADANPVRFSRTPPAYRREAPVLGEDNDYVFQQILGLTDDEIVVLRKKGVI